MAIAMPIQQDIRRYDRQGMPHAHRARVGRGSWHGRQVRQAGGLLAPTQARQKVRAQNGRVRGVDRPDARGGPDDAAQAAAHGQADLRPAGGRAWVRRLVQRGAPLREGMARDEQGKLGRVSAS